MGAWPPWLICSCPSPPVWLATQNHSTLVTERSAVPFLPVNPEYSATRNQVRGLGWGPGVVSFIRAVPPHPAVGWGLSQLSSICQGLPQGPAGTGIWEETGGRSFEHLVSSSSGCSGLCSGTLLYHTLPRVASAADWPGEARLGRFSWG